MTDRISSFSASVLEQHNKFITPEPHDMTVHRQTLAKPPRRLDEHAIANKCPCRSFTSLKLLTSMNRWRIRSYCDLAE